MKSVKRPLWLVTGGLVSAVGLSSQAMAAGFQLNEHSAAGLGRAFAGEAAMGDNAAAIGRNPALATQLQGTQVSGGVTYINPEISADGTASYLGGFGPTVDAGRDDYAPDAWVPNAYLSVQLNDRWSWGLSLNSHFGLSTNLGSTYAASDIADEAEIITYNINPSVAYRLTDAISLGMGVSLVKADATFGTSVPLDLGPPFFPVSVPQGSQVLKLEGDDIGWGVNLGASWQVNDALRLGLAYRSEVELELDGKATSDLSPAYNQGGSLSLDLPAGAELSAVYEVQGWTLSASAQWTEWSVFEALVVDFDDGNSLFLKEENFNDSWRYAIAAAYQLSDGWTVRAGLALDESAVSAQHRSLSIPDTDRLWYSAGVTYQFDDQLSVDLGFAYLDGDDVDLTEESQLGTSFSGTSSASAEIAALSVNYQF